MSYHYSSKFRFVFLSFPFLCSALLAQAKETTIPPTKTTTNFSKVNYFPAEETFLNETSLSFLTDKFTQKYPNHTSYDNKKNETKLNISLMYSFLKHHLIGIEESYSTVTESVEGVSTNFVSSGFSNPNIVYAYRALIEKDHGLNIDIVAKVSPNMITAKDPTITDNGNVASGSNNFLVMAKFSGEYGKWVWSGSPIIQYIGQRSSQNATTHNVYTTDSYMTYGLNGQGQYYFYNNFALDFGTGFTYLPVSSFHDITGVGKHDSRTSSWMNVGVNYIAILDELDFFAALRGESYSDSQVTPLGATGIAYGKQNEEISSIVLGTKVAF